MSRRLEIVRAIYDGMLRGELDPWLAVVDEDSEWRWPPGMIEGATVFRGPEGVRRGTSMWAEAWEQLAMEPQELLERGDEILVIVRYRARGRTSGLEIDEHVAHLWRFEGERLAEMSMRANAKRAKDRFLAQES